MHSDHFGRFRDGLAIRDRLAKADPGNASWQRDLIISCVKLAGIDETGARAFLARAQQIANQMQQRGQLAPRDRRRRSCVGHRRQNFQILFIGLIEDHPAQAAQHYSPAGPNNHLRAGARRDGGLVTAWWFAPCGWLEAKRATGPGEALFRRGSVTTGSSGADGPVGHAPPTGLSDSTGWPVSALSRLRDGIGEWGSVDDGQLADAFRVTSTRAEGTCRPLRAGAGGIGSF
jgi:hypothetical protein